MEISLQPLRIPTGWTVVCNDGLYEIDPVAEAIPDGLHSCYFREDMLLMENAHFKRVLHVGWFPEGDLKYGKFTLVMFESSYDDPIYKFRTRDRLELVTEIERILLAVTEKPV